MVLGANPTPDRAEVCGDVESESVTVSVPVRNPSAVGVNTAVIVQVPVGSVLPQVPPVTEKSPLATLDEMVRVAALVLDRVNVCAGDGLPTSSDVKV